MARARCEGLLPRREQTALYRSRLLNLTKAP